MQYTDKFTVHCLEGFRVFILSVPVWLSCTYTFQATLLAFARNKLPVDLGCFG